MIAHFPAVSCIPQNFSDGIEPAKPQAPNQNMTQSQNQKRVVAAFFITWAAAVSPVTAAQPAPYSNNFNLTGSAGSANYLDWNVQTGTAASANDASSNGWWHVASTGVTAFTSLGITGITGVAHSAGDTFEVSANITLTGASTSLGLTGSLASPAVNNNSIGIRLLGSSATADLGSVWADINFGGGQSNMGRVRLVDNLTSSVVYPSGTQASQPLIGGTSSGGGTFARAANIQGDTMLLAVLGTWLADGSLRFTVTGTDLFDNETVSYTSGVGTGDISAANITSFFSGTTTFFGFRVGGGTGETANFDNFNITVTPAPEPGTMALLAFGALTLCQRRRKASVPALD